MERRDAVLTGAYRVVLFDHVGAGASDLAAYDPARYASLDGYAADVVEIVTALDTGPVTFVGHSVSAMIGVLAAAARPELFDRLVLVGPSARYIDDADYVGGFSAADIEDLLEAMDSNYWAGPAPRPRSSPATPPNPITARSWPPASAAPTPPSRGTSPRSHLYLRQSR